MGKMQISLFCDAFTAQFFCRIRHLLMLFYPLTKNDKKDSLLLVFALIFFAFAKLFVIF